MHPATLHGFQDELIKISATMAEKANALFGLPLSPPKSGVRRYEVDQGSVAATTPDRSQPGAGGQSTANITAGSTMSPATGPGGA